MTALLSEIKRRGERANNAGLGVMRDMRGQGSQNKDEEHERLKQVGFQR